MPQTTALPPATSSFERSAFFCKDQSMNVPRPLSILLDLCEGNHQSRVDFPHRGQWRGALMFSLMCASRNGWANSRDAGDFRRHCVTDLIPLTSLWWTEVSKLFDTPGIIQLSGAEFIEFSQNSLIFWCYSPPWCAMCKATNLGVALNLHRGKPV